MKAFILAVFALSSLIVKADDIYIGSPTQSVYSQFYDTGLTLKTSLPAYESQDVRKQMCERFASPIKQDLETFKRGQDHTFEYEMKALNIVRKREEHVRYYCEIQINLLGRFYRFQKQETEKFRTVDGALNFSSDLNVINKAQQIRSRDPEVLNFFFAERSSFSMKLTLKYFKVVRR